MSRGPQARLPGRLDLLVAVGLLVLAAAVRVPALGASSLWRDDAWQALAVRATSPADLATYGLTSPGFAALLAVVLRLPGRVEVLGPAVPFALGCLLPPALHLVARRLGASTWGGAGAGVLLALSSAAAIYSTRTKPYTLDACLLLGVLLLAGLVLREPSTRRWRALLGVVALGALVSAQALLAGGCAVLLCLLRPASRRALGREWPLLAVPLVAAAVAYASYVRRSTGNVLLREWWGREGGYTERTLTGLWAAWQRLLPGLLPAGREPVPPWHADPVTLEHVAGAALVVLTAAAVVGVLRGRGWLVALALAPALVALAGSLAERVPFGSRVDVPFYPGLLLVLALATRPSRRTPTTPRTAASAVAAVVALGGVLVLARGTALEVAPSYPDHEFRPLVEALQRDLLPDHRLLVDTYGTYPLAADGLFPFTVERTTETMTGFAVVPDDPERVLISTEPGDPALQLARLAQVVEQGSAVWLVETDTGAKFDDEQYLRVGGTDRTRYAEVLRTGGAYELCRQQDWPAARLTLWQPRGRC